MPRMLPVLRAARRICLHHGAMKRIGFSNERDIVYADLPHVLYRLTAVT